MTFQAGNGTHAHFLRGNLPKYAPESPVNTRFPQLFVPFNNGIIPPAMRNKRGGKTAKIGVNPFFFVIIRGVNVVKTI